MNFQSLYRKVSDVLAVVMRSWPPHHRCHTDDAKRQISNGTPAVDAGDKLLPTYPSVSPQQIKNLCDSLNRHMTATEPLESYVDKYDRIVIRGQWAEIALNEDCSIQGARGYCRVEDVI